MRLLAVLITFACAVSAQTRVDLGNQSRNVDFSASTATKPFKTGTALPASCTVGEAFFKMDAAPGSNWYACTATNVWTMQSRGAISTVDLADLSTVRLSDTDVTVAGGAWGLGNTPISGFAGSTISIQSLTVTNASNTTPIVLTVNDFTGSSLRQGDTVMVGGVNGNTAANGTWNVEFTDTTHITLLGSTGNGNYTGGGTVAGTGNGTATIYGTPQGYISVEVAASTGLILKCIGSCVMNQVTTPGFAPDGVPIALLSISGGKWNSVTDERRFLTNRNVAAGQGITIADAAGTATVAVDSTVARTTGTNIFTGSNNFTHAARTAPHRTGTGTPAPNCAIGDTYFQVDAAAGQNLYFCTAANIWTQLAPPIQSWYQTFPAATCNGGTGAAGSGYTSTGTAGQISCPSASDSGYLSASTSAGWILSAGPIPASWSAGANSITVTLAAGNLDGAGTQAFNVALGCSGNDSAAAATFGTAVLLSSSEAASGRVYLLSGTPAIPASCTPGSVLKIQIQGAGAATIPNYFLSASVKVAGI